MRRSKLMVALTAVLALAFAGVAVASSNVVKITGGNTKVTVSSAAGQVLSAHHITVKALAPATSSGLTYTFPVSGGKVNVKTLNGVVRQRGGLALSNGTRTVNLRQLTLIAHKKTAALWASMRTSTKRCKVVAHHLRCRSSAGRLRAVKIANITGITRTGTTSQGTVKLTASSAALFNTLAGSKIASAGEAIGTGVTTVTVS